MRVTRTEPMSPPAERIWYHLGRAEAMHRLSRNPHVDPGERVIWSDRAQQERATVLAVRPAKTPTVTPPSQVKTGDDPPSWLGWLLPLLAFFGVLIADAAREWLPW